MNKTLIEVDAETGWTRPTVQDLAHEAGSKAAVAKACGVSERTVGYWRSGEVAKVPFAAVVAMCGLAGVAIGDVQP